MLVGLRIVASLVLLSFFAVDTSAGSTFSRDTPSVRGVWVANVASPTLASPENIREFVQLAHDCGINTLYVVVWNRGLTTYPSNLMQREFGKRCDPRYQQFDMLKEIIQAAHAKDMRVLAWFEFGFSCSYNQADGGHLIRKYPHWAAKDRQGRLATKNDFQWMNAFHPDVQDFILALIKEVLENYDVDGIQGDDRLPACPSIAGYDDWTLQLYRQQHHGNDPPDDHLDPQWVDWRADLLNEFMRRMHREVKQHSPQKVISAAPSIYPWSKEHYLQDWPTWVQQGWVDEVCPQVYREDVARYRIELEKIVRNQVSADKLRSVFPGILVQTAEREYNSPENVVGMVEANRSLGFLGEVFFYDAALTEHPDLFRKLYR